MLVYMAHPVRPDPARGETLVGNVERAEAWLRLCLERFPAWVVVAPWLAELRAYGLDEEGERRQRAAGMARNLVVARRSDAVLLVGGRVSAGMREEARECLRAGGRVFDLTWPSRSISVSGPCDTAAQCLEMDWDVEEVEYSAQYGDWPEILR